MKKLTLILALVVLAVLFLTAAAPGFEALARLEIINNTEDDIFLTLDTTVDDVPVHYFLTISGSSKTFTVERARYKAKLVMCGYKSKSANIDVRTNLKLNFQCTPNVRRYTVYDANLDRFFTISQGRNRGEPTMEKVYPGDLVGKASSKTWRFDY